MRCGKRLFTLIVQVSQNTGPPSHDSYTWETYQNGRLLSGETRGRHCTLLFSSSGKQHICNVIGLLSSNKDAVGLYFINCLYTSMGLSEVVPNWLTLHMTTTCIHNWDAYGHGLLY